MKENVDMIVMEVKAKWKTCLWDLEKDLNHSILVRIYFRHRTNFSH